MTPSPQKTSVRPADIAHRRPRFRSNRTRHFTESVIREMTRLAVQGKAVNLAQGFPDFSAPERSNERPRGSYRARFQPVRHHLGDEIVSRRHRREIPAVLRPRLRSGNRNHRLLWVHRRHDRLPYRRDESRRRSHHLRALLRKLRTGYNAVRRQTAALSACIRPIGLSIPTSCARILPAHEGDYRQHPE